MLATFCADGQRAELAVDAGTRLRHLQKDLCRIFGQPFPAMKACLHFGGRAWEDFEDAPFAGCDEAVVATVDFMRTDDPFFYDISDRTGLKGDTLEEQILYESEAEAGNTSLAYKDWLRARRRAAALVRPPRRVDIDYWLFAGSWGDKSGLMDGSDWPLRAWQVYGDVAFLPPWPEICAPDV